MTYHNVSIQSAHISKVLKTSFTTFNSKTFSMKPKMQSVQCVVKKIRSNLPRRRRSEISPILCPPPTLVVVSDSNASSHLTREVSCESSRVSVIKRKPAAAVAVKNRGFGETSTGDDEFRRITRSYKRKRENEKVTKHKEEREVELSESSCVESCSGFVAEERSSKLSRRIAGNGDENTKDVAGIGKSDGNSRSEVSCVQQISLKRSEKISSLGKILLDNNRENDVVSVNSQLKSPPERKFGSILSYIDKLSCRTITGVENRVAGDVVSNVPNSAESKLTESRSTEQIPNLISSDFDLAWSEKLLCEEVSTYSPAATSDIFQESSEMEFSFDDTPSTWFDSGSQFSEKSVGDTSPSPTFRLFRLYSEHFCNSNFSEVSSGIEDESSDVITWLRQEAEEYQESYQRMRKRERRQVYLHDYAREYCTNTDYGQLIIQQRLLMVHWMVEQSANKELQRETMFLGVNLLDRFLSKGYFKNKRSLQIAGIACLTLAIRIEENQPFNSIRQKAFHIEGNTYSRSEVVAMEWLVQEVLNFHCFLPTIYNFLWFYLKAANADAGTEKTAKYLAVIALLSHEQLCYWPSTVAAGLVILACTAAKHGSSCHQISKIHAISKDDNLPECMKRLKWLEKYIC